MTDPTPTMEASHSMKMGLLVSRRCNFSASRMERFISKNDFIWTSSMVNVPFSVFPFNKSYSGPTFIA